MLTKNRYLLFISFFITLNLFSQQEVLRNNRYEVVYDDNAKTLVIQELKSGKKEQFTPTFVVLFKNATATPAIIDITEEVENIGYFTVGWSGEPNMFDTTVGNIRKRSVSTYIKESTNKLKFSYTNSGEFTIESNLTLPDGDSEPILEGKITAQVQGYYSMGFYGAPEYAPSDLDELWQPLIWTDKIFPTKKYLTPAYLCTLPGTMLRKSGVTSGVLADPSEFTFNLMPTMLRSRFGVAIHNNQDRAQCMLFAPIMGSQSSAKYVNEVYAFKYRLFVSSKNISESYADLSQRMFGFGYQSRNNVLCSLNNTFDNMMEYCMNPYSKFDEDLKGYSYETDVKGSVRNTSALHALNLAFVTDSRSFYTQRAIPVIEYMLSRDKDLFSLNSTSGAGGQTASNTLGSPSIRSSELAMLYKISNSTNPFLLNMAKEKQQTSTLVDVLAHEKTWKENMALFNATMDPVFMQKAKSGADEYVNKRLNECETEFSYTYHNKSSFWSALAPKWIELSELYESTGDSKYLDAAYEGALRFARYLWMCPSIPTTSVLVNTGGKAPVYGSQTKTPMSIPEESVPAWRLSEMGLHTEAAGTAASHRAVFMAHHAPYLLRIAALKNDKYLMEIAKNAIIGRYMNFPGYHMNTDRTTVYEKVNFPLHTFDEITSTSMHYSHIVPMTSLILDYLVSDATARSNGKIHFHSQFVEAFAYLQGRTYCGYGSFYDVDSVILYMPKHILTEGNQQLNYLIARKADNLYLVFCNQLNEPINGVFKLNTDLVGTENSHILKTYTNNVLSSDASLSGNQLSVQVPSNGLVAVEVANALTHSLIQDSLLQNKEVWQKDFVKMNDIRGNGMILNFGKGNSSAFVYSSAPKDTYSTITIEYKRDNEAAQQMTDNSYPFEFTIPVLPETKKISYKLIAKSSAGAIESMDYGLEKSAGVTLKMEGDQVIYPAENAVIKCSFTGVSPWNLTFTQNGELKTLTNLENNPLKIRTKVSDNTIFEPVAVSNNNITGSVVGFAKVQVASDSIRPLYDGHVAESNKTVNYSTSSLIELKNALSWSREAYFTFDLSKMTLSSEKFVFRAFLFSLLPQQDVLVELAGNNIKYDTQLCWNNKDQNSFTPISQIYVCGTDTNQYIQWDLTSWMKSQLEQGKQTASLRLCMPNNSGTLCKFYSNEASANNRPGILEVKSAILNDIDIANGQKISLYPNPSNEYFILQTKTPYSHLEIWSVDGRLMYKLTKSFNGETKINISSLVDGIYSVRVLGPISWNTYKLIKTTKL